MFVEKVRKVELHNTNPYLTQAKCYNWAITFPNKKDQKESESSSAWNEA
jgi:hypothetical protein